MRIERALQWGSLGADGIGARAYGEPTDAGVKAMADVVTDVLPRSKNVLVDLGCGSMATIIEFAHIFSNFGLEVDSVFGFELLPLRVELAKSPGSMGELQQKFPLPNTTEVVIRCADIMDLVGLPAGATFLFLYDYAFDPQLRAHIASLIKNNSTLRCVVTTDRSLLSPQQWHEIADIRAATRVGGGTKAFHVFERRPDTGNKESTSPAADHDGDSSSDMDGLSSIAIGGKHVKQEPASAVAAAAGGDSSDSDMDGLSSLGLKLVGGKLPMDPPVRAGPSAALNQELQNVAALSLAQRGLREGDRRAHPQRGHHTNWSTPANSGLMLECILKWDALQALPDLQRPLNLRGRRCKLLFLRIFNQSHEGQPDIAQSTFTEHHTAFWRPGHRGLVEERRVGRPPLLSLENQRAIGKVCELYDYANQGKEARYVCRRVLQDCFGFGRKQVARFVDSLSHFAVPCRPATSGTIPCGM
jgi:hypothetical protein